MHALTPNGDESPKESQATDVVVHGLNHLTDVPLLQILHEEYISQ